jgi:hypothetical protein
LRGVAALPPPQARADFVLGQRRELRPTLRGRRQQYAATHQRHDQHHRRRCRGGGRSRRRSNVLGRVFGGDSRDFQYVSGSNITAPMTTAVPAPPALVLALGGAVPLAFLGWLRRRRGVAQAIVALEMPSWRLTLRNRSGVLRASMASPFGPSLAGAVRRDVCLILLINPHSPGRSSLGIKFLRTYWQPCSYQH